MDLNLKESVLQNLKLHEMLVSRREEPPVYDY